MYTPHTVTIYNEFRSQNADFEETTTQYITVLRGVFLDCVNGTSQNSGGQNAANSAALYIPLDVNARSADGRPQRYAGAAEFINAECRAGLWTIIPGDTFFVKGEVIESGKSFEYINSHHDNVFRVTRADMKDFGTADMQHIEVSGA